MTTRLFVFLGEGPEPHVVWARLDTARGDVAWGRRDEDDSVPPSADETIAIAPGAEVGLHRVTLPARSDRQARAAAPYAVEDEIAEAISEAHVALGPRLGDGGERLLAVAAKARMDLWLETLTALGAEPDALIPDYALLPGEDTAAAIVDLGDRVLARLPGAGFSAERDLAAALLTSALADPDINGIEVWSNTPHQLVSGLACDAHAAPSHDELVQLFNTGLDARPALNLLQGDYARRSSTFTADVRRWRIAASLAGAAAVGWLTLQGAQAISYDRQADAAYREAEALFREAFPDVRRIVNPQAQMRAQMQQAGSGGGGAAFVDLCATLFASLREAPAVELEALRYDADDGTLVASLVYSDYRDVEALQAAIAERGAAAEEGGYRQFGDQYAGDVTVRFR